MKDSELLNWIEKKHATVGRSGYRGRDGWEVTVADPGGHYMEERIKVLGSGKTARVAIINAIKDEKGQA